MTTPIAGVDAEATTTPTESPAEMIANAVYRFTIASQTEN
jgi:hypothetical protein